METEECWIGDCLHLMKNIPSGSVDMILCDLPYGSTANNWDIIIPFDALWEQYKRIIKSDGAIVLFGGGLFVHQLALSNPKMYKYDLIWQKSKSGSAFTAKFRPVNKHESILVFGRGRVKYNPQLTEGAPYARTATSFKKNNMQIGFDGVSTIVNNGTRHPISILNFQQKWRRQDQMHPTQKPVELCEWLIKAYSNEGDLVLDNCAGSFTTAIACLETKRNFICMEKEEKYYNVGIKRIFEWHNENK